MVSACRPLGGDRDVAKKSSLSRLKESWVRKGPMKGQYTGLLRWRVHECITTEGGRIQCQFTKGNLCFKEQRLVIFYVCHEKKQNSKVTLMNLTNEHWLFGQSLSVDKVYLHEHAAVKCSEQSKKKEV